MFKRFELCPRFLWLSNLSWRLGSTIVEYLHPGDERQVTGRPRFSDYRMSRQLGLSDRHTEVTVRPGLELLYFQVNRVSIPICLKIGLACGATDSSRETDAPSAGRQIPNNDLFFRTKARHRCSTLELIEINRHGRPPIR